MRTTAKTISFTAMPLALLLAFVICFSSGYAQRLTADVCKTSADCLGMKCFHVVDGQFKECTSSSFTLICHCRPEDLISCDEALNCPDGEMCSNEVENGPTSGVCLSRSLAVWTASLHPEIVLAGPEVSAGSTEPAVDFPNERHTGAPCKAEQECAGSRICYDSFAEKTCEGTFSLVCACLPSSLRPVECKGGDCGDGEVCSNDVDTPARESKGFCLSRKLAEVIAERMGGIAIDENICIGVNHLQHMTRHGLVYNRHKLARVYCDGSGSCATPGHLVLFRQIPMMMRSYCDLVGCAKKEMYVNSPKYRRGLIVETATDGLQFTAFAARYETTLEEFLISYAVRLGL